MRIIDILIVGGGAAGMLAAIAARDSARKRKIPDKDFSIVILERNRLPGEKIRISGGGRCNVTHAAKPDELLAKGFLKKGEQRFLRHALHAFGSDALLALLARQGVRCEARPDGKVFPVDGLAASDVLHAFESMIADRAVSVEYVCTVSSVVRTGDSFDVKAGERTFRSAALVLATGGVSYPSTGSRGEGLLFARRLGHAVVRASPALAPVLTRDKPPAELAGVSLRSTEFIASAGGKQVSRRGDVLFTHRGLSGPAVLSLSREVAELFGTYGNCLLFADLFADLDQDALQNALLSESRRNGAKLVRKFLQHCPAGPPAALIPYIMRNAEISADLQLSGLARCNRIALLQTVKRFPLGTVKAVPLEHGEVSAGGVSLIEVNPKTMESRIVPALFFAGELLDYAGEIGGFNLQAAFSTGWLAGKASSEKTADRSSENSPCVS
ncbi:MAG: aminoacetone oxidase family FAD-binding enzyme [Chlorobium sp.]|uniref:NAD(P)/FAD-dependent oxidoreductase n=1 Tax=Chlorobium sp. TaxID=1095 RepID=UPI0025C31961|nr:aminoacetone oxidase family FAD-binding enzyme [Chlorobium sp.]MCF8216252.1 aminoacetone oxidase family FAD-binding enzyme [Chlorobium sp.]MCF8271154.1 aminoacetone oxidase family FAD-binding enzyme [Chlorobium sp.]MCF8287528.1 aminoacetone oxidase family FAD-binding enzyme [Chlorobium sp.]MCF8291067.1 aminoacetone oxidase family FAD-binding enzyme [Chlorobium sp.]MCF8385162.1 aminoacetone oxidase family FAD-binding enzyme [Chlorobium sp.]